MRFVLHYRGPLRANGNPSHKHELRKAFHLQLKELWNHPPLNDRHAWLSQPPRRGEYCLIRPLGAFTFAPLVTAKMNIVAELHVMILRPEPAGQLLTQGGDIDNRLKTLFDSLTMPRALNALPAGEEPAPDQHPFFCLLEDDNLVTHVSVRTEHLLEPMEDKREVDLTIDVSARPTRLTVSNGAFA